MKRRRAAATGNRAGSGRSARARARAKGAGGTARVDPHGQRTSSARGDRDGQSAAAAAPEPFRWWGKEGWARPRKHHTFWHYWRHGHTLCGSYEWNRFDGDPKLRAEPDGYRCRKCELRRTKHRARGLYRDRSAARGW